LPQRSSTSIRKTLERIRKSYSFSKNDLKHEINFGKEFASERVEAAYIPRTIFLICSYLKSCYLIVTGSCNSSRHQHFMRENFLKTEISENISQKFHDQ